ncbi:MAG: cation diffusion facilitator family transporter [Ottowia sp.]|nr:cation diffusion facilitator family transporter [Ottowia sp.]
MQTSKGNISDSTIHERKLKTRITLVGAMLNLLLAGLKIVVGIIGHSQALVVDGVHSLSDLLSDGLVLVVNHTGSKAADRDHPYGHARFETAATVFIGVILMIVAAGFIYDAMLRLLEPESLRTPGWIVLYAAVASVLIKEWLYHYTIRVGRKVKSKMIEANAWHHRSDALSSLVVIGAFFGSLIGYVWLDAVAAVIVAIIVGIMGWQFAWHSTRELVDTGVEPETLEKLAEVITTVDGVRSYHDLRTRLMAGRVLIDVHLLVEPGISVSEGHRIGEEVRRRVLEQKSQVSDILVHVDTDMHDKLDLTTPLAPLRNRVLADLKVAWMDFPEVQDASRFTLYYHDEKVAVVLELPADRIDPSRLSELEQNLQEVASQLGYIDTVRCLLSASGAPEYD